MGTLEDGNVAIIREVSTSKNPTLEIQAKNKQIKFRYVTKD